MELGGKHQKYLVHQRLPDKVFNSLIYNVPKWSNTLQKSRSICCEIFKVRLTILGHYALKGLKFLTPFYECG